MVEIASQIRHQWAQRGFSCAIWVDPPGQVWEDFVHTSDELVMLIEGEIELTFCGNTVRPKAGEEVLIPAGQRHTVRNIGVTMNRWYYGYRQG